MPKQTPSRGRRAMRRRTANKQRLQKLGTAVGKGMRKVRRTAVKVADVAGAVVVTTTKRVKKEIARRHLRRKIKRTGRALKTVAKTAAVAAATAGAAQAAREIAAIRRA